MAACSLIYSSNDREKQISIDKDEFARVSLALEIDRTQLTIEEKYHILLENYQELEEELLRFSLKLTLHSPDPWETLRDATPLFDRRVLNFLSSARMYLDQIPSDISIASRNPESVLADFEKSRSGHYDQTLGYRVCEALRNYTQHKSLPVHGVTYGWRHGQEDADAKVVNYSGLKLNLSRLEADGKFKSTTLEELRLLGDNYDLKRFLREYMHCLGEVHINLRKNLQGDGEWAIEEIRQMRARILSLPDAQPDGHISLAVVDDDGQQERKGGLTTIRYNRRKFMQAGSRRSPSLVQIQLSSE